MKSWSEKGRPALFQALEAVCRQIDQDLSTELQEKEEKILQRQPLSRVGTESRLEKENASLRAEVAQLRDSIRRNGPSSNGNSMATGFPERQPLGDLSPNKTMGLGATTIRQGDKESTYQVHTQQDYAKLAAKHNAVLKARDQERAALKKRREDCNKWASYCDSLEIKIKKLEKELEAARHQNPPNPVGEPDLTNRWVPPKPALTDHVDSRTPSLRRSLNGGIVAGVVIARENVHGGLSSPAIDAPITHMAPRLDHEPYFSGQDSTNDGPSDDADLPPQIPQQIKLDNVVIKQEPSSDGPVIVSERPVRKRKRDETGLDYGVRDHRLKNEHSSSDPVLLGELDDFSPHESIDLDEAGRDNATPKKRRSALDLVLADGLDAEDEEFLNMRASKKHQKHLSAISGVATAEGGHVKNHRQQRQLDQGVRDLAEDDDGMDDADGPSSTLAKPARLDALLNTPSPASRPIINRPTRQRQSALQSASFEFATPQPRTLPFSRNQDTQSSGTPQLAKIPQLQAGSFTTAKRTTKVASTPLLNPDGRESFMDSNKKTHLRKLSPANLALTDFKINPKFNDGHDFAFSEVVRNKAERQNLLGCVDPQCCGKTFRALAILEREGIGPSITTRAVDIKLLEDYLGANAYRLGSMSREEKEELWLEAKMRELANKHGKHRERYTRRSSPPGFWNTDFPNTQEQQKEREEAIRQEKRLVEERYKDAMRGNGRWLFRDE